jgi:hypothetical protein
MKTFIFHIVELLVLRLHSRDTYYNCSTSVIGEFVKHGRLRVGSDPFHSCSHFAATAVVVELTFAGVFLTSFP